jgi:asparagine synthase (glutamine-hydrolysing)
VTFADAAYDEAPYARLVADHFRTEHVEVRVDDRAIAAGMPGLLAAVDQPSGDGINTAIVSRAVRGEGLKVALSGLGGDEIFGGYPSFARLDRFMRWSALWKRTPALMRRLAAAAVEEFSGSMAGAKAGDVMRSDGSLAQAFPATRQLFRPSDRRRLLAPVTGCRRPVMPQEDPYVTLLAAAYDGDGGRHGVRSLVSYAEARTYMHDVLLRDSDQMSMACGLEVRVPLLDHELVEYVMGLPDGLKFEGATPKALLTRSLGRPLPDAVTDRPKRGFVLPFDPWMRGALRSYCGDRLVGRDGLVGRGLVDKDAVEGLWEAFLAGDRKVTWSRPWALVALSAWLDRHDLSA